MDEPGMNGDQISAPCSEPEIIWENSVDIFVPTVRPLQEFMNEINVRDLDNEFAPYVFFDSSAYDQMWVDAKMDIMRERGGILVGDVFADPGGRNYVVVRDAIAAHNLSASSTHLQFRPESWKPIWDALYSDHSLRIVGWYHTHPRLGVFLSGTDLRTQRLYFSAPWQIAVVIDPSSMEIGCFFGSNGQKTPFTGRFSRKDSGPNRGASCAENEG